MTCRVCSSIEFPRLKGWKRSPIWLRNRPNVKPTATRHAVRYSIAIGVLIGIAALLGTPMRVRGAQLTHRYSFSGNANDSVGTANGVLLGTATVSGGSLVLNGASSYLALPGGIVSNYDSMTWEMWITDNGSGAWARIFDFGNDTSTYLFLTLPGGSGNLRAAYKNGGGEQITEWTGNRPPVGEKTHIVLTSDLATQTGRLYVNGVQVGINSALNITPASLGVTTNNWLGRSQWAADPYFIGSIDEFRIYSGALSSEEVLADYQGGPDLIPFGPVSVVGQPQNQSIVEQRNVTISASVGGSPPISLQWFRNSAPLPGATNLAFTFTTALSNNNDSFQLRATNVFNSATYFAISSNAILSVLPDTNPPVLLNAQGASTNGVNLFFSEALRADSVTNKSNYTLTGPGGSATISNAILDASGTKVTLTTVPLIVGSNYTVTVTGVRDLAGNLIGSANQASFIATIFTLQDIGSPSQFGFFQTVSNGLSLVAGGTNIGGTSDQFSFAYETRTGDFDVQLRLGSLGLSDPWAIAGLMARDGTSTNAAFAASFATPGPAGNFFQSRTNAGATATQTGFFPVNYPDTWLRLRRVGSVFTGYASFDGSSWSLLGSATFAASGSLQVGIAVSSHNPSQTTIAAFSGFGATTNTAVSSAPLPFEPLGPTSRKTGLVISEIMYHPAPAAITGSLEFVEIYNSDIVSEDMSGYRLSGDVDFTFPSGTILPSGGFLVVAHNPAALQSYYGISGVLGPFTNNLPNDSGTVHLRNELNGVVLEVNYGSKAPWPVSPDGAGHSLVLRRPSYGENDPRAWAASDVIGGSPGRVDSFGPEPLRGVVINEILAHTDPPNLDTIELFNAGSQSVDLTGCVITDDPDTNRYVIGYVAIPARGFVYFTETQLGFRFDAAGETIYLKNPAKTRVLDALRFEEQENGVSFGRYPDGGNDWYRLVANTFGTTNSPPSNNVIVINEIMYNPLSGDDGLQYVELYNRGSGATNLAGWKLEDGISFTFPTNTIIPANGYIVVANDAGKLMSNYANLNMTNTVGDFGGKLSHGGERITLTKPVPHHIADSNGVIIATNTLDIIVDDVTYGTGRRWGQWSDGGGSSLELIDPRADRRRAANWADSDESAKAPWTTIENTALTGLGMGSGTNGNGAPNRFEFFLQGPGECLVDEVECLSNGGTNQIANNGFESGASGWAFQGTHSKTTVEAGGAFAGSGVLHVRATERGDTGANRIRTAIALMPVGGTNQATLRTRVRWLRGEPNILFRLRGNWMECTGVMNVPANLGTPGLPNSRLVANAGPAIFDVSHAPILPAANQPVVVTARASDPDGVLALTLRYRVDPAATYAGVSMKDNGANGDEIANDGIFSATIPAQPSGTLVAFYVSALDAFGATTRFPADATRECLVNFGETQRAGSLGSYRVWVTQANLSIWGSREKNSNEGLDATFVYGNSRVIYNAQTLYGGSPFHTPVYNGPLGSFTCNYNVVMPEDDPLIGATDFNLEGQNTAESASPFNNDASATAETTAHWMARKIGVAPENRRYIIVYLNGQQRGLLYYDYQQPNREVLDTYYADDPNGNLHKIEDWFEFDDAGSGQSYTTARLENYTLNGKKIPARYRWNFRPRARGVSSPNDFTNLFALVDALNAPGPEPYNSATLNLVDVQEWMRMFAVEHMAGNWDSYGYERGKNMFAYKPQNSPWRLLLWDIQLVFGKDSNPPTQSLFDVEDPTILRLMQNPPTAREYWAGLLELANGPMLPANYSALMDERTAALLANNVPVTDTSSIKSWIAARRSYILSQMPQANFSTSGSVFTSSSNSFVLTGFAPIGVEKILVNGAAYPLTWTSTTGWRLNIPLNAAGMNTLQLQAVDRDGNTVSNGTTTVTVNYTGTIVQPEGNVVFNEIQYQPALDGAAFVELFNTQSNYTFDLSGWSVNGIDYTFPEGATLPPRGFLVLAENPYAFAVAYGATNPVFGQYAGKLDKDGETLTLFRPGAGTNLTVVDRVRYEAAAPWSTVTNGVSLQLIDAAQDNSRVANWVTVPTNPLPPTPQWVYATTTGTASSSTLYIYLQSAGDVYIDDMKLVAGSVAEQGANLLANGNFESPLSGTWNISANLSSSALSVSVKHSGNSSLHVVSTSAGSTQGSSIWQTISSSLTSGAAYTLSYWYLQSTNGGPLTVRLSGSGIVSTVNPAPPATGLSARATPGTANSVASTLPPFPPLWLNEVQANNITGPLDNFNQHDPWTEIFNTAPTNFSLANYFLTDTYTNLTKWAFPSGASVLSNGFAMVWCDNQTNQTVSNSLHAAFTLASGGGSIALTRIINGTTQMVDYLNYTNLPSNWSYGDVPDGQPFYRREMFYTTPGATNNGTSAPLSVFINEWMADNSHTLANPLNGAYR